MGNNWRKRMQAWLWPHGCLLCADPTPTDTHFCPGCARQLPWMGPACRACAHPLPIAAPTCGSCQRHPFAFASASACFRYATPVDALVQRLKYARDLTLARTLGEAWARNIAVTEWPDRIVPVPLHISRLRERGFNQSLELARSLARTLDIPIAVDALARIRATAPQAGLAPQARAANVRKAFHADGTVIGQRVVLIDDVMTTGHTADAAARALLSAGARSVSLWVLARA